MEEMGCEEGGVGGCKVLMQDRWSVGHRARTGRQAGHRQVIGHRQADDRSAVQAALCGLLHRKCTLISPACVLFCGSLLPAPVELSS
eukprot:1156524-Pelagomonas_calceolata.AAC.2